MPTTPYEIEISLVGASLKRALLNSGVSFKLDRESYQPFALALRSLGYTWEDVALITKEATGLSLTASALFRRYRHADTARLSARVNVLAIDEALQRVVVAPPAPVGES